MRSLQVIWDGRKVYQLFTGISPEAPPHLQQGCSNTVISHSASSSIAEPREMYQQGAQAKDEASYGQFVLSAAERSKTYLLGCSCQKVAVSSTSQETGDNGMQIRSVQFKPTAKLN